MAPPLSLYDDEEEQARALASLSPGPLQLEEQESPESLALRALASSAAPSAQRQSYQPDESWRDDPRFQVPDPPKREVNMGAMIAAALADLALNKGRSIPLLVGHLATRQGELKEGDWKMQRQAALDRANIERTMGGGSAESMALRRDRLALDAEAEARRKASAGVSATAREKGLGLQERGLQLREAEAARKAEETTALRSLESDATKSRQDVAIQMGEDPDMVRGMTGEAIDKWRPQIGQRIAASRAEKMQIAEEGRASSRKLAEEGRAQDLAARQFSVSGWSIAPGSAPTADKAGEARKTLLATQDTIRAAEELARLHKELGAKAALGDYAFLAGAEAQSLMERARKVRENLITSERARMGMGAPQPFELSRVEAMNPEIGSVQGFLRAGAAYPQIVAIAREELPGKMKVYGYEPGEAPAVALPSQTGAREPLPTTAAPGAGRFEGAPPFDLRKRYGRFGVEVMP